MRALIWSIRLLVFLVFFAFVAKNMEPVSLKFFFGISWKIPLAILLFGFFATGALIGVVAMIAPLWRQRRALGKLKSSATAVSPSPQLPASSSSSDVMTVRE